MNNNKVLLTIFIVSLFIMAYAELKNNIQRIEVQYPMETEPSSQSIQTDNKIDNLNTGKSNTSESEEKNSICYWKAIERKDSYNNELQFYSKGNVIIKDEAIEITSKKEKKENKMYTSGLVESTCAYKYGYFEFNIQVSKGKGIFPAIWLFPNDGDILPEVDLFEMIGSEPHIFYGVTHFRENGIQGSDYFAYEVSEEEQYTIALKWTPESLTWYIDKQEIYATTKGVPQEYMYIIINQAIGGDWPKDPDENTIFPNKFRVVSTRLEPVYRRGRN